MADQRQSRKDDYIEIPGEVFVMKNLFSLRQISGDGSVVTVPGSQGFIPPPVVLQRSLPSYNEVPGSQSIATLDGYAPTTEQGVKPKSLKQTEKAARPTSDPEYESNISPNAFDEFIIEGYENVTYEPSRYFFLLFLNVSVNISSQWRTCVLHLS